MKALAASLVSAPFDWLAGAMGAAAGWLFEAVWAVFDITTLVDVTSPEYVSVYNILFGIAVFVMLIFCLQLITGLIRRDPTALSRAALGLAKSVLGSFVVITLTALLLEIVDQLCIGIIQAAGETTESMGDKIALLAAGLVGINIAAPGVGAIITIFLAGLAIAATPAIVWLSLLVRTALLLVAIVFAPLAFSGASWGASRGWISKWAMFVIALICSKLVLVVMFLVAITQVSAPIDGDLASVADPIAGIVLMAMAAFAPYLTYKFIAFVGFDMYHAIGSEQDAKNALNSPVPVPSKPGGNGGGEPKKVLDDNDGGGGGGGKKRRRSRRTPHQPLPAAPLARGSKAAASSSRRSRCGRWGWRGCGGWSGRSRCRGGEGRQGRRHRRTQGGRGHRQPSRLHRRLRGPDGHHPAARAGAPAVDPGTQDARRGTHGGAVPAGGTSAEAAPAAGAEADREGVSRHVREADRARWVVG